MRAVLLVDEEVFNPDDPDCRATKWPVDLQAEYSVSDALRRLGHRVKVIPVVRNITDTIGVIQAAKPDFVFNMVEAIGGRREHDVTIVQILELLNIPYTGASPSVLMLARNKQLAKLVVADAGVEVPRGAVIPGITLPPARKMTFPAILKPLILDGSDGVTTASYLADYSALRKNALRQQRWLPLLCEEYIPGREIIVTMSGTTHPTVDSVCEMVFPENSPVKYATAAAKFDDKYRTRFGIHFRTPARLPRLLRTKIEKAAQVAYQALRIQAYGKLEFRVDGDRIVFIEANPNSQLSRFAKTSDFASIGYERFIKKIVRMALSRRR